MTTLEKEPARRYQSAGALAEDLERLERGEMLTAAPPGAGYRLRKFVSRNRLAVSASVIVLLALAGGAIAATIGMLRAEREAAVANTVSDFLENVFAEASPFSRSDEDVTARQLLDIAAENIETDLADQPLVQGRLMMSIGASYRGLGLFDEATPLLEQALLLLRERGASPEQIADAEYELGYHLIFMSRFERSRELLDSAIGHYRAAVGHDDERLAVAVADRMFNALRSGQGVPVAFDLLEREIDPATDAHGRNSPIVVQLLYMRCWALRDLGRVVEALGACRESLEGVQRAHENDVPILGHNTLAVAHTLRSLGRFEEALTTYEQVIEINRRLYGPEHPEIAYAHNGASRSHLQRGRREEALRQAEIGVAMLARVHGENSGEYARNLVFLVEALVDWRRFDEADALFARVIEIDTHGYEADSDRVAAVHATLARFRLQEGRFSEAGQLAAPLLERLSPQERPGVDQIRAMLTAGLAAHRLGNFETAERQFRNAYGALAETAENFPVLFAEATFHLAGLLLDQDKLREACPLAATAAAQTQVIHGSQSWRPAAAQVLVSACEYHNDGDAAAPEKLLAAVERLESLVLPGDIHLAAASGIAAELTAEPNQGDSDQY